MKNIFDLGFGVIHSRKILKDTIEDTPELLALLLKGGNILHIPTVAGWTAVVSGGGGALRIFDMYVNICSSM